MGSIDNVHKSKHSLKCLARAFPGNVHHSFNASRRGWERLMACMQRRLTRLVGLKTCKNVEVITHKTVGDRGVNFYTHLEERLYLWKRELDLLVPTCRAFSRNGEMAPIWTVLKVDEKSLSHARVRGMQPTASNCSSGGVQDQGSQPSLGAAANRL